MKLIIPLPEAGFDEGYFYAHARLGERHSVHRSPNRRGEAGRYPYDYASHATSQEHHSDQTAAPAKLQAATNAPPQTQCQTTIPQNAETLPQNHTLTSPHRKARPNPTPRLKHPLQLPAKPPLKTATPPYR
ncbi:MAG: hypothetical protein QW794_06285 [Thermosphaera sp.]